MIGKLKGIIDSADGDSLIIDVNGVGYVVFASAHTLRHMPNIGEAASLIIETHVREDHIHLYGFATSAERDAFRSLLKVTGVGTKVALAILGVLTPQQIALAVAAQDKTAFTRVSGIGPKMAARLLVELKDAFGGIITTATTLSISSGSTEVVETLKTEVSAIADAISALVNLGYSRDSAYSVITKVANRHKDLPVGELIREGLKELSK